MAQSRTQREILDLVARAGLSPAAVTFATSVFTLLGAAEARVHGTEPSEVHLHEVGALDSLADVIGCAAALESLGLLQPDCRVVVGTVALGGAMRSYTERARFEAAFKLELDQALAPPRKA